LFLVTFFACATHLIFHDWEWLTLPAAVFPAFGAAMAGIAFQAEFKRVGRRSKAMIDALGEASKSLKMKPINYEAIAETAIQATDIMIAEVLDWRVLFLERKPQLPA
jgi:hypothetical protein